MKLLLFKIVSCFSFLLVFVLGGWIALLSLERYFAAWSETARGLYLTAVGVISIALGICIAIAIYRRLRSKN